MHDETLTNIAYLVAFSEGLWTAMAVCALGAIIHVGSTTRRALEAGAKRINHQVA